MEAEERQRLEKREETEIGKCGMQNANQVSSLKSHSFALYPVCKSGSSSESDIRLLSSECNHCTRNSMDKT